MASIITATATAAELEKLSKSTTIDERDDANQWLDGVGAFGESQKEETAATLENMEGIDLTQDEIDRYAETAANNSQAHYMTHNPPSAGALTFFQKVVTKGAHPKGHAYSNVTGFHMRNTNQASVARANNTRLRGAALMMS